MKKQTPLDLYNPSHTILFMSRIVINPKVRHGKPTIEGTRITVDDVLGWLESGMSYGQIEEEYGISQKDIIEVIRYASSFIRGEEVHKAEI